MSEQQRLPDVKRYDVWGADEIERIVRRNAEWLARFLSAGIKAVMKDGRPLFTQEIPEDERLAQLLAAPPQFWTALEAQDPETAAALVATVIRARQQGVIPPEGPRANEVTEADLEPSVSPMPPEQLMTEMP